MAFTVETGTGVSGANAYASVEFVDAYHLLRLQTKWTGVTATKQACIVRATDFIDKRFGRRFRGTRQQSYQTLEWPRLGAYDDDQFPLDLIPAKLMQACAEYALRALLVGELAPDVPPPQPGQNQTAGATGAAAVGGELESKHEKVGPIEREFHYLTSAEAAALGGGYRDSVSGLVLTTSIPAYPAADLLMTELIESFVSREMIRG